MRLPQNDSLAEKMRRRNIEFELRHHITAFRIWGTWCEGARLLGRAVAVDFSIQSYATV